MCYSKTSNQINHSKLVNDLRLDEVKSFYIFTNDDAT